jgi:phage terminase large subunit-like protein
VSDPKTVLVKGTSYEAAGNLPPAFLNSIVSKYQGTRRRHAEVVATGE